jgi:hypothetical protein
MTTYRRRPEWNVTIKRPNFEGTQLYLESIPEWGTNKSSINFVSDSNKMDGVRNSSDLIGYEYNNSISNPAGDFSLTFVPDQDKNKKTWKDKLKSRDVVYIYEFGKLQFIGIVSETSYSMSFSGGKPTRSITVRGSSIGGLLQDFSVPMNKYLWYGKGVDVNNKNAEFRQALITKFDTDKSLNGILQILKEKFLTIGFGGFSTGFKKIIDKYLILEAGDIITNYPLSILPFQRDSNTLWSLFRIILPLPVYEIYGKFENGKYKMVCRETPFDYTPWTDLPITAINPVFLLSQDLSDSDKEVYTHYYSNMTNSFFTENQSYAIPDLNEVSVFDEEKMSIYGYKQLKVTFPFVDISKIDIPNIKEYLSKNSIRLYAWYKNNNKFQSGHITMMTNKEDNINIGERIKYLLGSNNSIEFYVEGVKRTMNYPDAMTSSYTVTRGFEYGISDIDGILTPQVQEIRDLCNKLTNSEKQE